MTKTNEMRQAEEIEIYFVLSQGFEATIINALREKFGMGFDEMDRLIQQTHIPEEYGKLAELITNALNNKIMS
jgi:hypothetical protein